MRRWIVIVLLFVLPAQFSWAAAASYCQHERDATPQHLGHHAHDHAKAAAGAAPAADAAPAGAADDGSGFQLPGTHADCAYCHLSLAKTLATTAPVPSLPAASPPARAGARGAASSLFERIERPNWQRARSGALA